MFFLYRSLTVLTIDELRLSAFREKTLLISKVEFGVAADND